MSAAARVPSRLASSPRPLSLAPAAPAPRSRIASIDLLRGLVIVLMVLDHARMFLSEARFDPTDLTRTNAALFFTRWITHWCAPVFVFLAGVSARISGERRGSRGSLARHLATRGLWLVALELTLVNFFWAFNLRLETGLILQVIWTIGVSMLLLAGLVYLPAWSVGALGLAIVAGHNLTDGIAPEALGSLATPWAALHVPGLREVAGLPVYFLYPLLPWLGVMALGYGFGGVFRQAPERRRRVLIAAGVAATALFVGLRASGLYGDPRPFAPQESGVLTLLAFLNVTKYGPSLQYVAMTLGPALLALVALERLPRPALRVLGVFGAVPLFLYLAHIPLVHAMGVGLGVAQGFPVAAMLRDFLHLPEGHGVGLPAVYLGWLAALALLYPLCRWFGDLKRRSAWPWLSYL